VSLPPFIFNPPDFIMGIRQSVEMGDVLGIDALLERGWIYTECVFESHGDRFPIYRMDGKHCIVKPLDDNEVEIIKVY
jgi:hypothetical protein